MERIELRTHERAEMIDITPAVARAVARSGVRAGLCQVFVPHTTAGVTINENTDPAVRQDILYVLGALLPRTDPAYRHDEGNSAAHAASTLVGASQTIPVHEGRLEMGTWQAVFFCEFDGPRQRQVWVQVIGR